MFYQQNLALTHVSAIKRKINCAIKKIPAKSKKMINFLITRVEALFNNVRLIDPEYMANQSFNLDRLIEDELIFTSRKVVKTGKSLLYNNLIPYDASVEKVTELLKMKGKKFQNAYNKNHRILVIDDSHLNYGISHFFHFMNGEFVAGIHHIQPTLIQPISIDKQLKSLYSKMLSDFNCEFPDNSIIQDMNGNMLIPSSRFGINMIYLSQKLKPAAEAYKSRRPELLPLEEYSTASM